MFMKIYGPKGDDLSWRCWMLHYEKFSYLYRSSGIVRAVKLRGLWYPDNAARLGNTGKG